jgi:ELWxxDGT repeat protein/VCBS repeat-containing protein
MVPAIAACHIESNYFMSFPKLVGHSSTRRNRKPEAGPKSVISRKSRSAQPKLRAPVRLSLEALDERIVLSGTPQLIDLNGTGASAPADFVQMGSVAFFTADNGTAGRELWRTDGTAAGTSMVRDIRSGSSGSGIKNLINVNGTLYFVADDGTNGAELWKSDGTTAGTVMVSNIVSGSTGSSPENLANVDGTLYFTADDNTIGRELWKSDGTAAGTVLVKDIFTGTDSGSSQPNSSFPSLLTNFNGTLYFVAGDNTTGRELWKSDGTSAGTVMVKDIFTGTYTYDGETYPNNATPMNLTVSGGKLFFTANDGTNGRELWVSDGTAAGTTMVTNIRAGNADAFSTNDDLLDVNGTLFFTATDATNGRELWKTNGTSAGTVRVRDIAAGTGNGISGSELVNVDGVVYFAANDGLNGVELWKSDGTTAGTVLVKNLDGASTNASPTLLTNVDGVLYFSAFDTIAGNELWRSDGTAAGTVRVADLVNGASGSVPQNLFNLNGTLLFSADNLTAGRELWTVDDDAQAGLATARLSIWIDGQQVAVPANIGRNGTTKLSQITTTTANTIRVEPINSETLGEVTLEDFFETWRTNAGQAGNNASARLSDTQLMGSTEDATKTVKMFVNGQLRTDYEDYVVQNGDQIVLVFGSNPVVSINTNLGPIVMELFEQQTPITVANFLDYINDNDYINSFFHRAAESQGEEFVIQGGGFKTNSTTFSSTAQFTNVPTEGQIQNEPGISNVRGTVAMAKLGGQPNSATSQFFVNLGDNSTLDSQASGAFTVFGQVLDMTTSDAIAALPRNTSNPQPYNELPLTASNQLVVIQSIEGLGDITGVKYVDANGNGQRDTGEAGVANVTIYIDANNNSQFDTGETSTTTDSQGRYILQVEPGSHLVRALNSPGHIQSGPANNNGYTVNVQIGIESGDRNFGEVPLAAPTGVDLVAASDTGSDDDDNLTRLNNAASTSTMQFVVSGVTSGAEVRLFSDGVLIGMATATGTSVTITTNGTVSLADGVRNITARQSTGGGESETSPALAITIDATAPQEIVAAFPATTPFGEEFEFNADSPSEGETGTVYSLADAPTGMTIDPATGEISWTPTLAQAMPHAFAIRVTDAAGNVTNKDVTLTVLGEIPAFPDAYTTGEDAPLNVNIANGVLANDDDEGGPLTAAVVDQPDNGTLVLNADGSFTYTPDENFFGTDTFTYRALSGDDQSNVSIVTITVNEVDDPVETTPDAYTVNEDGTLTVNAANGVLANDEDPDSDTLTVSLGTSTTNGTLTLNADGSFVYTPNANFSGADTFTYRVNDGATTSDPVTVTITVNATNDLPVGVADSYTVNEDSTLTVNVDSGVLDNDTDAENDTLTASVVSNPTNGTLTLNPNGSFSYVPNANFSGTDTFTYRASDGTGQSAVTTVTITVAAQPDAPVANDDTASVANDGSTHQINVLTNDTSNPDPAQTLTITAVTQGSSGGTVTFTGTTLSYRPAASFVGTETFTYTIRDTDGLTDVATVTVTVTEAAGNSVFGFVYIDANGNGVRDSGEPGLPGALITLTGTPTNGSGTITRTALSTDNGSYRFDDLAAGTYQIVQDQPEAMLDAADSMSSAIAGVVAGSDQFTNIVLSGAASQGEFNFGEMGLKPEYVSLRLFLASTPPQAEMLRETIARGEELAGNTELAEMIRAGDDGDGPNDAPVATADTYTVSRGGVLSVPSATGVLDNDTDADGDTLTATVVTQPTNGTLTLNTDGSFTYTPNASFSGTDTFTYRASDGTANSQNATVTITVSATTSAPVAVVDTYSVNRNTTLNVDVAGGLLANDSDADSTNLTAQIATNPTNGTLTLNANGSFTYVPNNNFVGTDTFTYRANDGTSSSPAVTVSITVLANNAAPVANNDSYTTIGTLVVTTSNDVLTNDTDANGDNLTASVVQNPPNGTLVFSPTGTFTYTPNSGFTGTDTFTYRASDGTTNSNTATVTITVNSSINNLSVPENSSLGTVVGVVTPPASHTGDLIYDFSNAVDSVAAHLRLAADDHLIGDPSAPLVLVAYLDFQSPQAKSYYAVLEQILDDYEDDVLVVVRHNPSAANANAFDAAQAAEAAGKQGKFAEYLDLLFENQDEWDGVADPQTLLESYATELGLNLTTFRTDMQSSATATRINRDIDVAEDENFDGEQAFFLSGQELDVDADFDDFADAIDDELADFDNMFFINRRTGQITVANPAALNFETDDSVPLSIRVRNVAGTTATVPVTVNITDVNEAPTAAANSYTTNRDAPLTVNVAQGVLANDTDVDGDTLTAQIVSQPASGSLTLNGDGSFTYTPNDNFSGTDSFTYRASDGSLTSNTVTVTITVADVNTAPVAVADTYTTDEDTTLTVDVDNGVLDNDTDVNDDTLTATLVTEPTHGTLTLNSNGSFTYEPDDNYSGTDTFTYTAGDGTTSSESVTVTITIGDTNAAPATQADNYTVAEDGELSIGAPGVLVNDTDTDGDPLTATLVADVTHGTLTFNADGSFVYEPDPDYSGPDSFTYRASDGEAQSTVTTVSITVTPDNTFAISESAAAGAVVGQVVREGTFGTPELYEIDTAGIAEQLRLAQDDHFDGDMDAPVVLIEYMDLSCPHCRDVHSVVEDLLEDFDGELLVVRRHLLLFNSTTSQFVFPNSEAAARAAEAAGRQGKFDEMVDALFENQDEWRTVTDPTALFNQYATEIGLNLTQFGTDRVDPAIDTRINRDRTAATALGLSSTPSFFLNREQIANPQTLEAFTPLIEDAIEEADAPFGINRETGQIFVNNPAALDAVTTPTVTLDVRLTDANGNAQNVPVTISVTNSAPIALNDTYDIAINGTLDINVGMGLLANDDDPDSDPMTVQLGTGPTNGMLTLNADGSFTYTPNSGYTGTDSFTYVAKDATHTSTTATATITIAASGSPAAITAETDEEDDLQQNDGEGDSDGDGEEDAEDFAEALVDAVMDEAEDWLEV